MKKLKLTRVMSSELCIPRPHYDLHTTGKQVFNIACILTDKEGAQLIRKWIKLENKKGNNKWKE